jgi:molybdopterin molybdotransferase
MKVRTEKPQDGTPALLGVDDARACILAAMPVMPTETVKLSGAARRILAEDVVAAVSHPPAPVSAMDGYACRSADVASVPTRLRSIGVSKAGLRFAGSVLPGTCVRIFTGAAVPDGADTIVLQEDASEDGDQVEITEAPKPGRHIRATGSDFAAGEVCVAKGRTLTVRDVAVTAACGHDAVVVRRRPKIAILSTGDELVEVGRACGPDNIHASNGVALAAAVALWGGEPLDLGIAPDEVDAIAAALDRAAGADLVVTTGGASVGDHDLVQAALHTRGFVTAFWKIAMRPGKPLMFGRLGTLPVLTMPGNPVSAQVCALLFLRPAMRAMLGLVETEPRFVRARLALPIPENDRREDYVRAHVATDESGRLVAKPYPKQDSGMGLVLARADGLIRRAPFAPQAREGDEVDVIHFDACDGF